jgi:hypothetical protein
MTSRYCLKMRNSQAELKRINLKDGGHLGG